MRNADYWKERMRILEEARNASNGKLAARLEREFDGAMREIEDKISGWYRRLAKNNEVALSEAKRLLKAGELKEFRWTVEEYIRHGEENGLRRNWAKELENASARVHINRLDALKIDLRGVIERLGGSQEKQTKAHLADQYADTVYRTMFEIQKGVGVYWDTAKVSEKQIETVLSKPWTADRRTFSDRIWLDKDGLLDEVYKQLARNVMLGRGPDASIKAIAKRFDTSKYNAGRLVMTESAYVSAEADGHVYQELDVERFEVDAALDGTTCGVCGDMDGRHFPRSEYRPGLNAPPFHPNCRCTTVPYIDDDIQRELDAKAGRAARNPETAKTEIVDDMTYADWKAKYVDNSEKNGIIKTEDVSDLSVTIDKFTPCLENAKTGEIMPTSFSVITRNELEKLNGWKFNWLSPDLKDADIYKLTIAGDKEIQGLIALTKFERDKAVYVNIAESAGHNLGKNKKYSGVGGHLFAIAAKRSLDLGYGGFVFMDAKNLELVKHYQDALGAVLLGRPHPYRMFIDEEAANNLLRIYTFEEGK